MTAVLFTAGSAAADEAQPEAHPRTITLSPLVNIPDPFSGGEILKAAYARLNITVEFLGVEPKRALALSSFGDLDGEIQRIGAVPRNARPSSS